MTLYLLAGGGHESDWVQNAAVDSSVQVEIGDEVHSAQVRVVDDAGEADRARTSVFAKYAPRSGDDLSEWRDRALPVAIELT